MKQLAALRRKAGLTQDQLAKAAKIRQATISDWERGIQVATLASIRKVAKTLKCSLEELL